MKNQTIASVMLALMLLFTLCSNSLQAQATLIADFDFNGNYVDGMGNATMGACGLASSSYSGSTLAWTADSTLENGGGFLVKVPANLLTEKNYSIAVEFSFSQVVGYRKVLDFKNLSSDLGLYVNNSLRLYSAGGYGPTNWVADSTYTILFTRSATDDTARCHIFDGSNLLQETHAADFSLDYIATIVGIDRVFAVFMDDSTTSNEFSPAGTVDRIRVWNGVVQLADIITASPDPVYGNGISLYPNPGQNHLNLQLDTPQSGTLQVFDASGKLVASQQMVKSLTARIDMSQFSRGLYMVKLGNQSARWIKQ